MSFDYSISQASEVQLNGHYGKMSVSDRQLDKQKTQESDLEESSEAVRQIALFIKYTLR